MQNNTFDCKCKTATLKGKRKAEDNGYSFIFTALSPTQTRFLNLLGARVLVSLFLLDGFYGK